MARPQIIDRDAAFEFMDKRASAGQPISVRLVRKKLGGSTNTVAKFVREWKEREAAKKLDAAAVPANLATTIADNAAAIWADLLAAIRDQETELQERFDEATAANRSALQQLEDELEQVRKENRELDRNNVALEAENRLLRELTERRQM